MLTKVTKQGEKIYKAGRKSCKSGRKSCKAGRKSFGKVWMTITTFEWEIQTL
jgi:hypothetical protein